VIAELFIFGFIVLRLAVRLFRFGSIEYTKKVSLKTVFARPKIGATENRRQLIRHPESPR
jgi:hypothetical protein